MPGVEHDQADQNVGEQSGKADDDALSPVRGNIRIGTINIGDRKQGDEQNARLGHPNAISCCREDVAELVEEFQ